MEMKFPIESFYNNITPLLLFLGILFFSLVIWVFVCNGWVKANCF